jgi:RecQ family ATP-dependent DNA helicase
MDNFLEQQQNVRRVLRDRFKIFEPKDLQIQLITSALLGKNIIAALPTGWGKSILFQASGLMRSGLAVIITPTVSLMNDQVKGLISLNLTARALHSQTSDDDREEIWELLDTRALQFLYISPQAFKSAWAERLKNFSVSVFGIDEAHIIVDWGMGGLNRDYAAAYSTLRTQFPQVPVVATTGTATRETIRLIMAALKLPAGDVTIVREAADRPDIHFSIAQTESRDSSLKFIRHKVLELVDRYWAGSKNAGIVFTVTQRDAERLAASLQWKLGMKIPAYTSNLGNDDPALAESIARGIESGEYPLVVTTAALGQGINIERLRWVIHDGMRLTIEEYWQQIGRIGRDGDQLPGSSEAILVGSPSQDAARWAWALVKIPRASREIFEQRIDLAANYYHWPLCRRSYLAGYLSDSNGPKCSGCDICDSVPAADWNRDSVVDSPGRIHDVIGQKFINEFPNRSLDSINWVEHKLYGVGIVVREIGEMKSVFFNDGVQNVNNLNVRPIKLVGPKINAPQDQGNHQHGEKWISVSPKVGTIVCVNREVDGVVVTNRDISLLVKLEDSRTVLVPSALCSVIALPASPISSDERSVAPKDSAKVQIGKDFDWRNDT